MTTEPARSITGTSQRALFLVELRAAIGVPTDLNRMHDDLTSAIGRLRAGGVDVEHTASYLLPDDARYLCLVRALEKATAELACDAAGLTAAPVHVVDRCLDPSSQHCPHVECTCNA
ncbi:hypothetical protein [Ornithinimicrobium cerasi]|uniref:hypothetical protein n=1 Tax=Ornithinimicrobium cerasi TaxID=2248773 RepID=UPI000EFDD6D4|nr:hypothetical protein [Ornithinimicrobium cerasi]